MTLDQFNQLSAADKWYFVEKASKLVEILDGFTVCKLYRVECFFVETRKSLLNKYKKFLTPYLPGEVPMIYKEDIYEDIL